MELSAEEEGHHVGGKAPLTRTQVRVLMAVITVAKMGRIPRPGAEVARLVGIDLSGVSRHVGLLTRLGYVDRRGRQILAPEPFGGWIIHCHEEHETCHGAAVRLSRGEVRDQMCGVFMAAKDDAAKLAAAMQGVVDVYRKPKRRRALSESDRRNARRLLGMYERLRRRSDPFYSPTGGDHGRSIKVMKALKLRHITPDLYGEYLESAFDVFGRMVKGSSFPPVAFLGSDRIIDQFVSSLGPREINVEKAAKLLGGAGLPTSLAPLACTLVRNWREAGMEPPPSLSAEALKAVALIAADFDSIGYRGGDS